MPPTRFVLGWAKRRAKDWLSRSFLRDNTQKHCYNLEIWKGFDDETKKDLVPYRVTSLRKSRPRRVRQVRACESLHKHSPRKT